MKKDKRLRQKFAYFQDAGTWPNDIPVFVNMDVKEIEKWMVKKKVYKDYIKAFNDNFAGENWCQDGIQGRVWHYDSKVILWLKDWKNDWVSHDTLMHECLHIVQFILMKDRGMEDEHEAQAYQLEYLVKGIRTKLSKAFYG